MNTSIREQLLKLAKKRIPKEKKEKTERTVKFRAKFVGCKFRL